VQSPWTRLRASELVSEIYSLRTDVENTARSLPRESEDPAEWKKSCRRHYHPNYLWLEVIAIDGEGRETIVALNEPPVPPSDFKPVTSIANRDDFLADLTDHKPDRSAEYYTIVSEVRRVEVLHDDPQSPGKANVIWAGTYWPAPKNDPAARDRVVIGALDLDASLPTDLSGNGDSRSPLCRMNTSPRHLAVLANDPWISDGPESPPFTADLLVHPGDVRLQLVNPEYLVKAFQKLYRKREDVIQDCMELTPPVAPREVIPLPRSELENIPGLEGKETFDLQLVFHFLQSTKVPGTGQERRQAADALDQFAQDKMGSGQRIGRLIGGVRNVRLLAQSREDVLELADRIDDLPEIDVDWQKVVPCDECYVQFVLFPVRSADFEGGRRYYGLAQAAFEDEMQADVVAELRQRVMLRAFTFVLVAAVLAIAFSLFLTRPLKQITVTAQAVAEKKIDLDPANGSWREGVSEIAERLPVKRRDEIGVLARVFSQMLDEVIEGHERLRELNAGLDRRVRERTKELELANEELKTAQLDDEQRADLQKIRLAASQLLALINDILDYQKSLWAVSRSSRRISRSASCSRKSATPWSSRPAKTAIVSKSIATMTWASCTPTSSACAKCCST